MSKDLTPPDEPSGDDAPFLLYEGEDGEVVVKALMHAETIWLTQKSLAELFETTKQNISSHLQNIFEEGELCLLYTSPSPRDRTRSRMPSSA